MKLSEIVKVKEDFAIDIPKQFPDFDPKYSAIVGSIDAREVWGSRCWKNKDVFAFRTNDKVDAFIAIDSSNENGPYYMNRAWCDESLRGKGLITALLGFFTKKLQNKLYITDDEPLTPDGFNWIYKLIKSPHGFKIHNGNGKFIDAEEFKLTWEKAKSTNSNQSMSVVIENHRRGPLFGNLPNTMFESIQYIGSNEID